MRKKIVNKAYFKLKRRYVQIYTKAFENLEEWDNFLENNKSQKLAQKLMTDQ